MKYYQFTLSHSSGNIVLENNPIGWDDNNSIVFARSDIYHSILRKGATGLSFVKEGKTWIDNIYYQFGTLEKPAITIKIQNPITLAYDLIYFEGILDISTININTNEYKTDIEIIDGSIEAKFTSRDEIEINLKSEKTLDDNSVSAFTNSPISATLSPITLFRYTSCYVEKIFNYETLISDIVEDYALISQIYSTDIAGKTIVNDSQNRIYTNTDDIEQNVKITSPNCRISNVIEFDGGDGATSCTVKILMFDESDVFQEQRILHIYSKTGNNEFVSVNESFSINENIVVGAGYYLELRIDSTYTLATATSITDNTEHRYYLNDSYFEILETSESIDSTNCEGFLPYEALSRAIQIITNQTDTTKLIHSEILGRTDSEFQTYSDDGEGSLQFITNGFAIRTKNKAINVSFRDLFKSISSRIPLGCWYDRSNERFLIEDYDTFWRKEEIYNLGTVSNLQIKPANDFFYNLIKAGYNKKVKYEEINGVNEINVLSEYSNILDVYKKTLDISSKYRGDSVGIELARRAGNNSEDTDYDEDNFIIDLIRDSGFRPILGEELIQAESQDIPGIDKYYNLRFTPKRILLKNAKKYIAGLHKNTNTNIKFTKSQLDNDLITIIAGETSAVIEKDDILASSIYNPNFLPQLYDFESPMSYEVVNQLNTDPHGYFVFYDTNGKEYRGFLIECGNAGYRKDGNWLLIAVNMTF